MLDFYKYSYPSAINISSDHTIKAASPHRALKKNKIKRTDTNHIIANLTPENVNFLKIIGLLK